MTSIGESLVFTVRMLPVAKARHRSFMYRGKDGQHHIGSHMKDSDEKGVSEFIALADPYAPDAPLQGPIELRLVFVLPIPKSRPDWWREAAAAGAIHPCKRPDRDNLEKNVLDTLTRSGRFWRDDSQIVRGSSEKVYGPAPETRIEINELPQPTREEWIHQPKPAAAQVALL